MKLRMLPLGVRVSIELKSGEKVQGVFLQTNRDSPEIYGRILSMKIRTDGSYGGESTYDIEEIQSITWDDQDQTQVEPE